MITQHRPPGVYIVEENTFSESVVQVATGIPAFIGTTAKAMADASDVTGVPVRISSIFEFTLIFGGACAEGLTYAEGRISRQTRAPRGLFQALSLFFANGGMACWIVSVGAHDAPLKAEALMGSLQPTTGALETTPEPDLICIPEAVCLSGADWRKVMQAALAHCAAMQDRMVLVDLYEGAKPLSPVGDNPLTGPNGLYALKADHFDRAAAYYPWLNTTLVRAEDIGFDRFDDSAQAALIAVLRADADTATADGNPDRAQILTGLAAALAAGGAGTATDGGTTQDTHRAAQTLCPDYATLCDQARSALNVMPPSSALAGVYARTDSDVGVYKAPANIALDGVASPVLPIGHDAQETLQLPLNGMAVNPIRSVIGRGTLVWGARTMDANSQDRRYISVRRTLIMLEQSIKGALMAYVFEPNTPRTWATAQSSIDTFLNTQWRTGALAGARPQDAYAVSVGAGERTAAGDFMQVVVQVALTRPGEFIAMSFEQEMQTA